MRNRSFVDCFMLMGTALSLSKDGRKLPEMGRPALLEENYSTTFVNISAQVLDLKIMDIENMQLEVELILNQKWQDSRLGANPKTKKKAVTGQIWKPKVVNTNGERMACESEDTVFWRGFGDEGNVLLSEKIKIKTSCTHYFQTFPFDTQFCELKFGSYRFPKEEVSFQWSLIPVDLMTSLNLNEFSVINIITYQQVEVRLSGNFSNVVLQIILERNYTRYMHCMALPCLILMILNYTTLWFDLTKCNTRFILNFIIFVLFMCIYYISVCHLQPVPYLKALDIFVLICESFSLVTLLETLFIDKIFTFENLYHLKTVFGRKHSEIVYWLEMALKISYPVFFIFSLVAFAVIYID